VIDSLDGSACILDGGTDLTSNVSHQVEIKGTLVANADAGKTGTNPREETRSTTGTSGATATMEHIRVTSVRSLSNTCSTR
jgi:hypothetical protein